MAFRMKTCGVSRWIICPSQSFAQRNFRFASTNSFQYAQKNGHAETEAAISSAYSKAKPFNSIPGPRAYPVFGNLLSYKFGKFSIENYPAVLNKLHQEYGPICREKIGGRTVVHVFDPEDARTIFANEDKSPLIVPLQETAQQYRKMRQMSLGLGNMNGEEWYRLRQAVQQLMMRPKQVQYFLPLADSVAEDLANYIQHNRNKSHQPSDFWRLVQQWVLESSGNVVFENRLGCIGAAKNSWINKMIDCNATMFRLSGELKFSLPLHKCFPFLPKWRRLVKVEDFFYKYANRIIDESMEIVKRKVEEKSLKDGQHAFLAYLLSRQELSEKDIVIIGLSLFGDGLNTTAPTLMFNLYNLAKNVDVQEKLYDEVRKYLSPDKGITKESLDQMSYLKACVKETFRFMPNGTDISRILQRDLILSGYQVPAGTEISINMIVQLRNSRFFAEPNKFLPERWLRDSKIDTNVHPYLLIPFGHGTRMCAGRRFAEQDLYVAIARLISKFQIQHVGEPMRQKMWTLLLPEGDTQFEFVDRN